MIFKTQDIKYTKSEIEMSRLVIKNNNGLVYCTELFFDMYPDATFIALIRNPIALYESHKRRNTPPSKSPQVFALNSSIYIYDIEKLLLRTKVISNKTLLYEMPQDRSLDIDSKFDLKVVRKLIEKK